MLKNTAGQTIGAQMVSATDGAAFSGAVTVYVCGDAGIQAVGSTGAGACAHEGNGYHTYTPSQAETNHSLVAFTFTGAGAIPATVQVETASASGDPWSTALPAAYPEGSAGYLLAGVSGRLEEQVADGPVVVVPAPDPGQTTAWCMCYDAAGAPEAGVILTIHCVATAATAGAYDAAPIRLVSDVNGLAAGPIPRGTGLTFSVRRGTSVPRVTFGGVDAATLALPTVLGAP